MLRPNLPLLLLYRFYSDLDLKQKAHLVNHTCYHRETWPLTCHFLPFLETPLYLEPLSVIWIILLGLHLIITSESDLDSRKTRLISSNLLVNGSRSSYEDCRVTFSYIIWGRLPLLFCFKSFELNLLSPLLDEIAPSRSLASLMGRDVFDADELSALESESI